MPNRESLVRVHHGCTAAGALVMGLVVVLDGQDWTRVRGVARPERGRRGEVFSVDRYVRQCLFLWRILYLVSAESRGVPR